jgi:DNA-binding NarL/FixJ family response regulator
MSETAHPMTATPVDATRSDVPRPGDTRALRILIADDHPLLRRGLRDFLEAHPGWQVCGEAVDGREAVLLAEQLKPDVAVVDLIMPELNGIEATRRIRAVSPATAVLLLAGTSSERIEEESISAGARGFLLKSNAAERIVAAIEALVKGETYFVRLGSRGGGRLAPEVHLQPQAAGLTSREIEITQLLAEGKTNWCIATILGISVRTVETHRANVMRKLGLQSVVELVHYAVRNLMVEPLPSPASATPPFRSGGAGR